MFSEPSIETEWNAFGFNAQQFNGYARATPVRTIAAIIRDSVQRPFRKLEMKRRSASTGLFESSWQDVTDYVTRYGSVQTSLDDARLNVFLHSGLQLSVRNDSGEWNPEWDGKSLFYGYLTRNRTLFRVSAGYTDGAGNIYPDDPSQGVFVLDGEVPVNARNEAMLNCKSLVSIFEEERADAIDGFTDSMTASQIVELVRDATDGSGNFLFRDFVTSTAWTIQTTSTIYTGLATTTSRADMSVWKLLTTLAESEFFVVHATRNGGINFSSRDPNEDVPQYSFSGAGFRKPNIISLDDYREAVKKLYTHIRLKFAEAETETSFATAGERTAVSARSVEWAYGRSTYAFTNLFIPNQQVAEAIAQKLHGELSSLRSEVTLQTKFAPHIELLDRVSVNYREGSLNSTHLWDHENWAADTTTADVSPVLYWASETSASIDFRAKNFKIIAKRSNLDTFVTTVTLREVET